ncbi:host-nuclease inhibitor Gam family protein [Vitreoscilla stercoraria]|uniref:Host-nuclease inhibitor Gam family protein n=1 Tax=Vitreoscilla stercoraria TaxID=61 RepID=A0ABY4EFR1_VITST|nr:host-nuclease inhibitor Gam family protein [Vitreoscilla stercoraria]UOO93558.1 host-nuclease inhibitor Gam family protein [Vitreoscilla stercoraria]
MQAQSTNTLTNKADFEAAFAELINAEKQLANLSSKTTAKQLALQEKHQQATAPIAQHIASLRSQIAMYASHHRDELTNGGKSKSIAMVNGAIKWRKTPSSVKVTGDLDTIMDDLKKRRLSRFLRTKTELNKTAIMAEAEALQKRPIAGIEIVQGSEVMAIDTEVKA